MSLDPFHFNLLWIQLWYYCVDFGGLDEIPIRTSNPFRKIANLEENCWQGLFHFNSPASEHGLDSQTSSTCIWKLFTTDLQLIREACQFTQFTTNLRRLRVIHLSYKFPSPIVTLAPKTPTTSSTTCASLPPIIFNAQIRWSIFLHPATPYPSKLRHEMISLRRALTARTLHPADQQRIVQTTPDTLELTPPAGSSNFNRSWRNMQQANCSPLEFSLPAPEPTNFCTACTLVRNHSLTRHRRHRRTHHLRHLPLPYYKGMWACLICTGHSSSFEGTSIWVVEDGKANFVVVQNRHQKGIIIKL